MQKEVVVVVVGGGGGGGVVVVVVVVVVVGGGGGGFGVDVVAVAFLHFSPILIGLPRLYRMLSSPFSPTFVDHPGLYTRVGSSNRPFFPSASFLLLCVARSLHRRLLSMHVTATLSQAAGVAMYTLPVSKSLCGVTHRILGIMAFLFDVSKTYVFLVGAKTDPGANQHVPLGDRVERATRRVRHCLSGQLLSCFPFQVCLTVNPSLSFRRHIVGYQCCMFQAFQCSFAVR